MAVAADTKEAGAGGVDTEGAVLAEATGGAVAGGADMAGALGASEDTTTAGERARVRGTMT